MTALDDLRSDLRSAGGSHPPGLVDVGRLRTLLSLALGLVVIGTLYGGPPVEEVMGIDLRFGLTGPNAGDPWKWLGAGLLLLVVIGVERLGPASLMLRRPTSRDLTWVLYTFGAFMTWSWLLRFIAPQDDNEGIATIAGLGVAGVLVLIASAAVTEEVVYRGFLAERIGALLAPAPWARWAGAAVSVGIFILPHLAFFGPSWLLHQLPGTLAVAAIALIRRNLVAAMLLHALINAPILIPTIAAS